jgi:hypothetical protein
VGATGSYESMKSPEARFPCFPNPHIRTNAFMLNRQNFCQITRDLRIPNKLAAHLFESGPHGLTRSIIAMGLQPVIVGRNGRGYSIDHWVRSEVFRQARQDNLLIADNQTRLFAETPFPEKRRLAAMAWGRYLRNINLAKPTHITCSS